MNYDSGFDVKERVRQSIDIVDLVSSYVQLRREGRGYKALCPWHDDSRPSLQINPDRQSFKCWVCDIGGDVFSFMMKMENVDFREALQMLAERAGISLKPDPPSDPRDGSSVASGNFDKRQLLAAMQWAVETYHRFLRQADAAASARKYLQGRGITDESITQFKLGVAPDDWEWIAKQPKPSDFSPALLERVDLIGRKQSGGFYDRFRGRLLFPIFDPQGRPVALGGRILPELAKPDAAKYINSRETPLFTKSKMLYGLHTARNAIGKSGQALVMEGYTDCIVAHQCGFTNAVAVLGTALGADHIQLLRRFNDEMCIVSVLDGDDAGRKRANEVLELFVAANADLRILTLPDNLDPCDFLLAHGAQQFGPLIERAPDALEHAFSVATTGIDLKNDVHASTRAVEQLLGVIARAPRLRSDTTVDHRLREEKFLQRLARDFRLQEENLRDRLIDLRRKQAPRPTYSAAASTPSASNPAEAAGVANTPVNIREIPAWEREFVELLLVASEFFERMQAVVRPDQLTHKAAREIYRQACRLASRCMLPNFERLLLEINDPVIKTMLVTLDEQARKRGTGDVETWLTDVLNHVQNQTIETSTRRQEATLKQGQLAEDEQLAALLEIQQQLSQQHRNRLGTSAPTDG